MTNAPSDLPSADALSFEDALKELEQVVRHLEEGRLPLEEAIGAYARGAELKERCEALLSQARLKVEAVLANAQGALTKAPLTDAPADATSV